MRKFWRVNIEISNICNLQCSFCPEVIRTKKRMPPDDFRHALAQIAPLTNVITLHLMGDPLVHPELDKIIAICAEFEVQVFLVTNGLLLREKESELLLHPVFRQISFSLHAFPDNFPQKDPTTYLDRIFSFTEKAFAVRPRLFINYRLWNLADSRGVQPGNQEILERIEKHFGVTVPKWDLTEKKNLVLTKRLSLHLETEFIWPNLNLPLLGTAGTCHGLSSHFGVLVDGTVVPCCLDKEGSIPLGNLQQQPLRDILLSPRAQAMVQGFRKGELVEDLCRRCQYIERFSAVGASKSEERVAKLLA